MTADLKILNNLTKIIILFLYLFASCYGFNDGDCSFNNNQFMPIVPNSKYVLPTGNGEQPLSSISSICQEEGLEPATLSSKTDLEHLGDAFGAGSQTQKFSLGPTWNAQLGIFTESDGTTPITFQAFEGEPGSIDGNYENTCTLLMKSVNENDDWVMDDTFCQSLATPLCMFPKKSTCYRNSPPTVTAEHRGLQSIGSTINRSYYVGITQDVFTGAFDHCILNGYKLLDLDMKGSESEDLLQLLKVWKIKYGLQSSIGFWTSGMDRDESNLDILFTWMNKETYFIPKNSTLVWEWDNGEPSDNTMSGNEDCVSFMIPTSESFQGSTPYIFRMSNCKIPYYYVCYHDETLEIMPDTIEPKKIEKQKDATFPKIKERCPLTSIPTLNLSKSGFTTDEILNLADMNSNFNLSSGRFGVQMPNEMKWKADYVYTLTSITKSICSEDFIPKGFINKMEVMIMIYMKNIKSKKVKASDNALRAWDNIVQFITNCSANIANKTMIFENEGDFVARVNDLPIAVVAELVDDPTYHQLDLVIESLWFMFQLSVGTCYPFAQSSTWLVEYFFRFQELILDDFEERWLAAGDDGPVNYGAFLGDFDLTAAVYNLRVCAIAAHEMSNTMDRLFARPMHIDREQRMELPNYKLNKEIHARPYNYN